MYSYEGRYDLLEIFPSLKYKKDHLNSAEEWVKYAKNDTINKEINIWDRTYWEFDNTCWLAPIEQSLDIIDHITFIQPANCRRFISIMYGFDEKYRKNKILEELITTHICPQFKDIPYDYQGGYIPKYVTILRKLKYNEEVFRGKIRDYVYGHIMKNGKK